MISKPDYCKSIECPYFFPDDAPDGIWGCEGACEAGTYKVEVTFDARSEEEAMHEAAYIAKVLAEPCYEVSEPVWVEG